ncbi:MAG: hypothetical protein ACRDD8_04720 [Bacteroidales bacterium]
MIEQYKTGNEKLEQDLPVLRQVVNGTWKKEDKLKELYQNPDGFRVDPISKDPELIKKVDDLFYNECGADNPKTLEDYQKMVTKEMVSPPNESNRQQGVKIQ